MENGCEYFRASRFRKKFWIYSQLKCVIDMQTGKQTDSRKCNLNSELLVFIRLSS